MAPSNLSYKIKKSNRKTLSIYIEPNGDILILAPENKTDAEINLAIESKKLQIFRKIAELNELQATKKVRELVSGESYLYLGRNYRLKFTENQDIPLKIFQGYFSLRIQDKEKSNHIFKDFYRKKGLQKIAERIKLYQPQMGVSFSKIQVMELQNRWASYSKKTGSLCFNWKCMMLPVNILDYVVVHELVHIKHQDHSPEFWGEVDKVMPNYHERKNWLRYNGASIDL